MNVIHISSFIKRESKDDKTNIYLPIYYIVFTRIDFETIDRIQRVDIQNNEGNKYYYNIKTDLFCMKELQQYITIENIESFLWCIIPVFETY